MREDRGEESAATKYGAGAIRGGGDSGGGGTLVEEFEVAGVPKPRLEGGIGQAQG